jgi:hypothetical protein
VFVVAHIPWLLAAIDVVLRTTSRRALALGQLAVSLATGSQLLAGHPQFVWYSLLAELAFVAWRLRNGGRWRRIPVLGWATILRVLLGAIQVLPTLHALAGSDRGSPSRDFPLVFSLERANLIQLWSPYALNGRVKGGNPHEFGLYGGSVCTVAVVWLFMRWHRLGRFRSLFTGSAIFATTMLVLALGSHGGLYGRSRASGQLLPCPIAPHTARTPRSCCHGGPRVGGRAQIEPPRRPHVASVLVAPRRQCRTQRRDVRRSPVDAEGPGTLCLVDTLSPRLAWRRSAPECSWPRVSSFRPSLADIAGRPRASSS